MSEFEPQIDFGPSYEINIPGVLAKKGGGKTEVIVAKEKSISKKGKPTIVGTGGRTNAQIKVG